MMIIRTQKKYEDGINVDDDEIINTDLCNTGGTFFCPFCGTPLCAKCYMEQYMLLGEWTGKELRDHAAGKPHMCKCTFQSTVAEKDEAHGGCDC